MNRILGITSALLMGLFILVPVVAAANPIYEDGRVIVSVRGDVTFPAGQRADSLVIVDGAATIEGDVRSVFVLNGTARFVGSHSGEIVAIASRVSLDGGTVISGDVRVISTTVTQASGSTITGSVKQGLDWAQGALFIGPALFILYLGFVVVSVAAALALAALASRQVRAAEALLNREAGATVLAAFGGFLAIVGAAIVAMVTIIGIPLGLALLVGFLPLLAFVGYLVAGIWVGEWILRQVGRGARPERPYLAAIVGVLAVSAISMIPVVGGVVSFIGFGAVVLLMWRTFRGGTAVPEQVVTAATASATG